MRYLLIACLITGCSAGAPTMSDTELRDRVFSVVRTNVSKVAPPATAACIMDRLSQSMTTNDLREELAYQEKSGGMASEKVKTLSSGAASYCGL